jgi:hypothetical protein
LGRKSWTRNRRIFSFQSWCIQCSDSSTFSPVDVILFRGYNIYFTYIGSRDRQQKLLEGFCSVGKSSRSFVTN